MNEAVKQKLLIFFKTSCACFDFAQTLVTLHAPSSPVMLNKMHELHKLCLQELEKENPDRDRVDYLIRQMEDTAEQNSLKVPNFSEGEYKNKTTPPDKNLMG